MTRPGFSKKGSKLLAIKHKSFDHLFKGGGVEGRSPSSPIAMGEIPKDSQSSGGETKPSGGRFDRGEP